MRPIAVKGAAGVLEALMEGEPAPAVQETQSLAGEPPLVVDLDGCLLRTDMLIESTLALIKLNPVYVLALPLWLLRGKARLKSEVASRVELDVALLPVSEEFLAYLHEQRRRGRTLVLATASHRKWADAIAGRFGLFSEVLATADGHNLTAAAKGAALVNRFGDRGFDYAGDSAADLPVWRHSRQALLVNAPALVARRVVEGLTPVERRFMSPRASLRDSLHALRVHQWLKNLLLFVPLFTAHAWTDRIATGRVMLGLVAFCLCASATYLINDLLDLDSDRHHPRKRRRPFASGVMPLMHGIVAALLLLAGGLVVAFYVNLPFLGVLLAYIVVTLAYSLHLKAYVLIDTMTLAGLYTLRIIAGGAAASIELSFWLLAFSVFLFLSLANVKRCSEINTLSTQQRAVAHGRDYRIVDLGNVAAMGVASGYIAVLVLALFMQSPDVVRNYSRPWVLWLLCPVILYWISRMWIKAGRGEMHDDPLVYTVYDRASRVLIIAAVAIVLVAL